MKVNYIYMFKNIKQLISVFILSVFILSGLFLCCTRVLAAEALVINSLSSILIDSKTGQVLFEQNASDRVFPASTTKIMTAILALEKGDMNKLMTASQAAVNDIGKDGMNIGIVPGEEIRMEDLLHAMLIRSANETANIISENISPSRGEFIDLMNSRARELGATSTNFVNPCGKDSAKEDLNHLTTASDMSKIARHAFTLPQFREIISKKSLNMPDSNKHKASYWPPYSSTNKMLLYEKYKSPLYNILGGKTGYTDKAGNNLISSAVNNDGMEIISVILGVKNAPADSVFAYTKTLLEYGFRNFSLQKLAEEGQVIKNIAVEEAVNNSSLDLVTGSSLSIVMPNEKESWNLIKKEFINENIIAPVTKGDKLGYLQYERNGIVLGRVDIVAATTVQRGVKTPVKAASEKILQPARSLKPVYVTTLSVIIVFLLLRFILKRFSKLYNSRRQERTD